MHNQIKIHCNLSFYVVAFSSEFKNVLNCNYALVTYLNLIPNVYFTKFVYKQKHFTTDWFRYSLEVVVVIFKAVNISANNNIFRKILKHFSLSLLAFKVF